MLDRSAHGSHAAKRGDLWRGRALLLLLFDRGANLGNDLGAEAVRHGQQSGRDRKGTFDGGRLWTEDLAPKALARFERRRLRRAGRYGRLQTDQLGLGQDELDHLDSSLGAAAYGVRP